MLVLVSKSAVTGTVHTHPLYSVEICISHSTTTLITITLLLKQAAGPGYGLTTVRNTKEKVPRANLLRVWELLGDYQFTRTQLSALPLHLSL